MGLKSSDMFYILSFSQTYKYFLSAFWANDENVRRALGVKKVNSYFFGWFYTKHSKMDTKSPKQCSCDAGTRKMESMQHPKHTIYI